jgi:hypothetical protein
VLCRDLNEISGTADVRRNYQTLGAIWLDNPGRDFRSNVLFRIRTKTGSTRVVRTEQVLVLPARDANSEQRRDTTLRDIQEPDGPKG